MKPLISVIVPVYKVEAYLPRCLESIVNQTYRNLEIILVDDGSPDTCGTICDDYASRDHRIRVIHQKNCGLSAARNAGLDVMRGEYLMFVDSDDWLSLDAIQVLYDRMTQDGSDMAVGKHTCVYDDGTRNDVFCSWMTNERYSQAELFDRMGEYYYMPLYAYGKLYRCELFDCLRFPGVKYSEDMAVFPTIFDRCTSVSIAGEVIYYYYQRKDSLAHSKDEVSRKDCLRANLQLTAYFRQKGSNSAVDRWFGSCIHRAFECDDKRAAMEMIIDQFEEWEIGAYMLRQNWKVRLKWCALRHPTLAKSIVVAKKLICR